VELCRATELHAAFREESRTSFLPASAALQEVREPGFPVELCRATELHAAFREESRTSFLPASAALQEIREAKALLVVFCQGKPHLAIFIRPQ
jgi:hypothetical protein